VRQAVGSDTVDLLTGLGIDEYFTRTDASSTRDLLSDALGTTVGLADSSGTAQPEYSYAPFGAVTAGGSSSSNEFRFTGREDDGTGLYYYRARYYSPDRQRFIAEDPIGLAGGDINLYAYVLNDPIDATDPTGEFPQWLTPILVGAGVGGSVNLGIQLLSGGGGCGDGVNWASVATSALIGAALGSVGPGGPFFGRERLGAPRWWGNVNTGDPRYGWSFYGPGRRNWWSLHGDKPARWHIDLIPGPRGSANLAFGIGGGLVGGVSGVAMTAGRGKCGGSPPAGPPSGAPPGGSGFGPGGGHFGGAGASSDW
jgi:RHS repeat-associated protein